MRPACLRLRQRRCRVHGPVSREGLQEAERYASGEYLVDLMRGLQDKEAVERVSRRVAELTGLDPELTRRLAGRIDMRTVQRELRRDSSQVVSAYDTECGHCRSRIRTPSRPASRTRFSTP